MPVYGPYTAPRSRTMSRSTDLGVRIVALLVVWSAAVLRRDGEAPPRLGRGAGDESERSDGGDAAERESRKSFAEVPNGHANRPEHPGAAGDVEDRGQRVPRPITPVEEATCPLRVQRKPAG